MDKSPYDRENKILAETLKQLRLSVGLNQTALAERAGLRQSDVSKVESGVRQVGYLELRRWLGALNCDVGAFDAEFAARLDEEAGIAQFLSPRR